jgi:hypothetical protein
MSGSRKFLTRNLKASVLPLSRLLHSILSVGLLNYLHSSCSPLLALALVLHTLLKLLPGLRVHWKSALWDMRVKGRKGRWEKREPKQQIKREGPREAESQAPYQNEKREKESTHKQSSSVADDARQAKF